jgi:hypothetical protein
MISSLPNRPKKGEQMKQSTTEDKEGDNSSDQNKEIRSLIQRGKPFFSNTCQSGLKQVLAMFGE